MKPLVSILIPAYNAQKWIGEAIRSALAQTWERKEIIVVDDGSKDQTLLEAQQFERDGVMVINQPNQGSSAARNRAYANSRGDYVQWLDADDLLAPDKIALQMNVLSESASRRTLLSSAWGHFIYRTQRANFVPTSLWCDLAPIEWLLRNYEHNHWMQTATWLVSRELTEAAGPWDTRLLGDDDGEYFSRVLLASDGIRFVPDAKVFYRVSGPGSLSYIGRSNKKLDAHFLSMQLHINHIRAAEDSARVRAACLAYLQTSLIYFYPERPDIVERAEELAEELGGELQVAQLSWKYAWIKDIFGWTAAKRTQLYYNRLKSSVLRSWDRLLFGLKI